MEAKDNLKNMLMELENTVGDLRVGMELFETELHRIRPSFIDNEDKEDNEERKHIDKLKELASGIVTWIDALNDIDVEDEVMKYEKTIILDKIKGEKNGEEY